MIVSITSSGTLGGSQFADVLSGGGLGKNFGTSEASIPATVYNVYLRHDGVSIITNFAVFLRAYSQTYGGEYSASADLVKVIEQGNLQYGFHIDFDWDSATPFETYTVLNSAIGTSEETAIEMPITAIFKNVGGSPENPNPLTPAIQGQLGPAGWERGDTALLKCRWVIPTGERSPGRRQIDLAYIYNFTT